MTLLRLRKSAAAARSRPITVPAHGRDAFAQGAVASARPTVQGKFLFVDGEKLYVRGTTYGTFSPDVYGGEFPDLEIVERDFAQMAASGLNAVRLFTAPPRALLDVAQRHGLRAMVGLSAERYVGFLVDKKEAPDIEELVREQARSCAGHPALLCYAIGNEIPASIVRWLGRERVERYLERLFWAAKAEDPDALITYANYPSTEYLQLPFLDLVCFNVYLESRDRLESYLARLQNVAGDRPLIMGEVGLDSRSHGEATQARVLDWQVRTAFAGGCAGAFVFAWTDEWHTGGEDVYDWDFGLTARDRRPKPALAAVAEAFRQAPFPASLDWPRISVIVCSCNGARTLRDCLDGLSRLDYPNFEVIVVDDGSDDGTPGIARTYGVHVISTPQQGLGSARNTGLKAATGEIVAYLDDDAFPDPDWLRYIAATFMSTSHVGVGGPNIPPPDAGSIAACVANAPGGPTHVLLSDDEAEHIPGCNMAFRKDSLEAIGGFDPRFRAAGDDVDICWRLQERGWTLGFSPSAVVWHHRRNSVRAYWKQQHGYGKAEGLLEQKWPEKYNAAGHIRWSGRVYANGWLTNVLKAARIYHGTWGSAPFQRLYQAEPRVLWSLPSLPDWYLLLVGFAGLSALGVLWRPLLLLLPVLVLAAVASLAHAWLSSPSAAPSRSRPARLRLRALTALLHVLQPMARLSGRLRVGLVPWRYHAQAPRSRPTRRTSAIWSERWRSQEDRLRSVESFLRGNGIPVLRGGADDRWDLEIRTGLLGSARLLMGVEDHALGKQLVRLRSWPRCAPVSLWVIGLFVALGAWAGLDGAWGAGSFLAVIAAVVAFRTFRECAAAMGSIASAFAINVEHPALEGPPRPLLLEPDVAPRSTT